MPNYILTFKSDNGLVKVYTSAVNKETAIANELTHQHAPKSAVIKIEEVKEVKATDFMSAMGISVTNM